MDLDYALRVERPIHTPENLNEIKIEKWDWSNRLCIMIMKNSISESFWGSLSASNAQEFFLQIKQYFKKNEKSETYE